MTNPRMAILLANGFEPIEATAAIDVLRRAGVNLTIVGVEASTINGMHGFNLVTDTTIDAVKDKAFDVLVMPGGAQNAKTLGSNADVQSMLKKQRDENRWIAAICASPAFALSDTSVMGSAKGTCYPSLQDGMRKNGHLRDGDVVNYVDKEHKIVTSEGPCTAFSFAFKLVELFVSEDMANKVRGDMLWDKVCKA